jgi:hypothetical protein
MALAEKSPPPPPRITGLVCDGTFQLITGGVDSSAEDTFAGPVHLVLVDREGAFVEVRAQAYMSAAFWSPSRCSHLVAGYMLA